MLAATFGVVTLLAPAPAAAAQTIPYKVNFQGRLTDNSGNILSDGSYNVKFRLFDAATSGVNKWEGDRIFTGGNDFRVTVQNGLFNIQFGDTAKGDPALTPALFNTTVNGTLYLEVELPTPATATCATNGCATFTEGPMTPRQPLASSPYAFNADTIDGLDSTAFGQLAAANSFSDVNTFAATAGVSLTVKAAAATHSLDIKDSSNSTQAFFDANGIFNIAQTIQATTSTVDLGTAGSTFRTGYFGTSVVTAALNATSTGGTVTTNAGTLQRTAVGATTIDLKDPGTTTLAVTNSGGGVAGISATGGLTIGTGHVITVGASAGSALTCASGQIIDGATVTGGVVTGGTCAAAGGGDKLLANWTSQQATTATNTQTTVQFTGTANSAPSFNNATHVLTLPSNASKVQIETKAGGGGGGATGTASLVKAAAGGGEGAYAKSFVSSLGSNYYFKVGTGGAGGVAGGTNNGSTGGSSCFGTNSTDACTSPTASGVGGSGGTASNAAASVAGGAGGLATSGAGDVKVSGAPGGNSTGTTTTAMQSGPGGGSGGGVGLASTAAAGNAGTSGGGGSGALQNAAAATSRAGGAGGDGYVSIAVYVTVAGTGSPATLQSAYDNASNPEIILSSSGLTVRDSVAGVSGSLFEVQDDTGGTTYLSVDATGVTTTGVTSTGAVSGTSINATTGFQANGTPGVGATCGGGQANLGAVYSSGILVTAGTCTSVQAAGNYLVQAPTGTTNTVTAASGAQALIIRGTNGTATHLLDIYNTAVSPVLTSYFDQNGAFTTTAAITAPTAGSTINGVIINAGSINAGSGNITTSGTISGVGSGLTSLPATSLTGTLPAISGANLTNLNPTNLAAGTGAVTIASAAATGLTLDSANGTLLFGTNTTTLQKAAAALTIDLATAGTSALNIRNSNGANVANLDVDGSISIATGQTYKINNVQITSAALSNDASITKQGNTFNGASQLVALNASSQLPAVSGALVTNLDPTKLTQGSGVVSLQSAAATALTVTSNAAATWSTSGANQLTLQSGSGTLSLGSTTTLTAGGAMSIDSGTTNALNIGAGANAKTITIGNNTGATSVNIVAGTGGVDIADDATTKTINIGGNTNSGTDTINIATNATAADIVTIGSTNAATRVILTAGANSTTANRGVIIGSSTSDATQINFQLDSSNVYTEAASTCTTTLNQGALYYNNVTATGTTVGTNAVRACVDGNWEDIVSTAGLGILLFGVVPDSGSNPGDLPSLVTPNVTGPCKVSAIAATANAVNIQPCTAYSGGRKVEVAANATYTVPLSATNTIVHICLSGTNAALQNLVSTGTAETSNLPAFSANAPILCLADVRVNGTTVVDVYDTRAFTTSTKEYVTASTAVALGWTVAPSGKNVIPTAGAAATVRGVIVASNGATSTTAPNAIIVTAGPTAVKAITTGPPTAGAIVRSSATAGLADTVAVGTPSATIYANLGLSRSTVSGTLCTATRNPANCDHSLFFNMNIR